MQSIAASAILEYLRYIWENDVDYEYESKLTRAVCPAIKSIRSDEGTFRFSAPSGTALSSTG